MNTEQYLAGQKLIFLVLDPQQHGLHPLDTIICLFVDEQNNRLGEAMQLREFVDMAKIGWVKYPKYNRTSGYSSTTTWYLRLPNILTPSSTYEILEYDSDNTYMWISQNSVQDYLELVYYSSYIDQTFRRSR